MEKSLVIGTCCICDKKITKKVNMKTCPSGIYCTKCHWQKISKKRDKLLPTISGVKRKKDIMKKAKSKRDNPRPKIIRQRIIKNKSMLPKIESIKYKPKNPFINSYLTRNDKEFLYSKFIKQGLLPKQSNEKVKNLVKHLEDFKRKLKAKKVSSKEIDRRFKEEYAKFCSTY